MVSNNPVEVTETPKNSSKSLVYLLIAVTVLLFVSVGLLVWKTLLPVNQLQNQVASAIVSLPPNAVRISGCISHEGEHWVEPDKLPAGPFYVTFNNKVVAIEYMFTPEEVPGSEFAHMNPAAAMEYLQSNRLTVSGLVHQLDKPLSVPKVDVKDWSIHWTPPHAGFVIPHYDMHFYLVDAAERATICPDASFADILPTDLSTELKRQGIAVPEGQ